MKHREGWFGYRQDTPRPRKPPGRLELAARRKTRAAGKAAIPYAASFALTVLVAVWLHHPALAWLGLGAVLALAADRLREHYGWMRKGSRLATRRRRRDLGPATFGELRRKVSAPVIRHDAKTTRPSWHGRTRRMPATEAGFLICTVTKGKLR